jgi:hypothetical protein
MSIFGRKSQTTQQLADEIGRGTMTGTGNAPARSVNLVKQSGPAVNRADVEASGGVSLTKKFDKAGLSLSKRDLDGIRAQAVMLLDYSGSMGRDYADGTVQELVERSLGFALQIDVDGEIPVYRFGSDVFPPVNVNVRNYQGAANGILSQGPMGSTNLTAALKSLLKQAQETTAPIFAIVVTDGSPDNRSSASKLVKELAGYPVFLKLLAIRPVDYLQERDDMGGRLIDNADTKFISDPKGMSDLAFADAMVDEWSTWISAAQAARILV